MDAEHIRTATDLAERLGVAQSTASRWLANSFPRDDETRGALQQFLGMPDDRFASLMFTTQRARKAGAPEAATLTERVDDHEQRIAALEERTAELGDLEEILTAQQWQAVRQVLAGILAELGPESSPAPRKRQPGRGAAAAEASPPRRAGKRAERPRRRP
jgi:transcriptional regulator with XRE-family HTH domain